MSLTVLARGHTTLASARAISLVDSIGQEIAGAFRTQSYEATTDLQRLEEEIDSLIDDNRDELTKFRAIGAYCIPAFDGYDDR